jgi:Tol biopolymer transport system component
MKIRIALIALAAVAAPAGAHHRQTPPIVQITTTGDSVLPRVPAPGGRLTMVLPDAEGHPMIFRKDWNRGFEQLTGQGENANPTISSNGNTIAWDSDCSLIGCSDPGRQIFQWFNGIVAQVTHDPTGTSVNPALCARGSRLGFESEGDPAGTGNAGARQVFVRDKNGVVMQISQGAGTSSNIALDRIGYNLVFDSTSDPAGADTGVSQIWLLPRKGVPTRLTSGDVPSRRPAITQEGRFIAFESRADLLGDGHDTSVNQIFLYDVLAQRLSQITDDAQGCSGASIMRVTRDTRVGFVCHGQGFFHLVVANQTYRLPITGGDTIQAVDALGTHFMVVSTTSELLGVPGQTSPGHEIYLLNLFKLAGIPIP